MNKCPNCSSKEVLPVYKGNNVPTYQNVLLDTFEEAIRVPRGTLELIFCEECTFLYNAGFDEDLVGYGVDYENNQTHSQVFTEHVNHMARKIVEKNSISNHKILEIGCGTGYFLEKIISQDNKNIGVGFDKSLRTTRINDRITLYNKYYEANDEGNFDAIISRHVVEHIINNNIIISNAVKKNPKARFFIETPSLEWIIKNNTFFDIFYEHCSYFSFYSISKLLNNHDLYVTAAESVFNEQYMWIEAIKSDKQLQQPTFNKLDINQIQNFFLNIETLKQKIGRHFPSSQENKEGKIAVWAAGAKGLTFVNMVDAEKEYIDCLIDINPRKQNKFCAGTGHPIHDPSYIDKNNISKIFIMNENYMQEIVGMFPGSQIEFISIEGKL